MKNTPVSPSTNRQRTAGSEAEIFINTDAAPESGTPEGVPGYINSLGQFVPLQTAPVPAGADMPYGVATGTNAYTVTVTPAPDATNPTISVKFTNANTAASTLNVNAGGVVPIVKSSGAALVTGDILANTVYLLTFDGTNWQLIGNDPTTGADVPYGVALGTDAYTVTVTPSPDASNPTINVKFTNANTGASTINVNGAGVIAIVKQGAVPLVAGDILAGTIYELVYDGVDWQLIGTVSSTTSPFVAGAGANSAQLDGTGSLATGDNAVAEGDTTTAAGDNSHSEGDATQANGPASHAEGNATEANGFNSHAEGLNTTATGAQSHAEGEDTIALGINSHAEGLITQANAEAAHAEGNSTIASGAASHAEGNTTIASGDGSHAEGDTTLASGLNSHAGGTGTQASGDNSFNHSDALAGLSNAEGDRSAVLGGSENNINAAASDSAIIAGTTNTLGILALRSVILGGTTQTLNEPDTVLVQELRVANAFKVARVANTLVGTATLVTGTVTVANTSVKTGAFIFILHNTPSGTIGILSAPAASIVNNTSFVINSSAVTDNSDVHYLIINP